MESVNLLTKNDSKLTVAYCLTFFNDTDHKIS